MPVGLYAGANVSNGNGVATLFPYNFKIFDKSHVEVKVDGVVKALGPDYDVTGVGNANGGNVVFVAAPANGAVVQRARKVPYKRDTDYQANGDLREDTVDPDFDLLAMQVQQLAADILRAFKAPLSVTLDQVLSDAGWAVRAGMYPAFDAMGNFILSAGAAGVPSASIVQVVDTIAQLKAIAVPGSAVTYLVRGYNALGDGGGGFFYWNAADVTADNAGTVIALNAGGNGRFNRLF